MEPTLEAFHRSTKEIRGIRGVVGSGKSTCCIMEMLFKARAQKPWRGVRRTKWAVIRETFPQLRDTTIPTFLQWAPVEDPRFKQFGSRITHAPPYVATLKYNLDDGTRVHAEFIFLAMRDDADVEKLKSLEITGAFINEAGAVKRIHYDMAYQRCSRFPAKHEGGCSWSGVIMDTNPPDDESWWYKIAEIEKPPNAEFFCQPPAILMLPPKSKDDPPQFVANEGQGPYPRAENVSHQNKGYAYWLDQVYGKPIWWIKVFLMGEYGTVASGKPVYPMFQPYHYTDKEVIVYRALPLMIGIDFGRTPCAIICQLSPKGQFRILDELTTGYEGCTSEERMGIRTFAQQLLLPHLRNKYDGMNYIVVGDPAGGAQNQITEEDTCMSELRSLGIPCEAAYTQNYEARLGSVESFMSTMIDGEPGLIIHAPTCKTLVKGFQGGYKYAQIKVSSSEDFKREPDKTGKFSHIHDALQYIAMRAEGGGQVRTAMHGNSGMQVARKVIRRKSKAW